MPERVFSHICVSMADVILAWVDVTCYVPHLVGSLSSTFASLAFSTEKHKEVEDQSIAPRHHAIPTLS